MIATCYPYTMSIEIPIPDFVRESRISRFGGETKKTKKAYISPVVCNLPGNWRGDFCWNFQEVRHLNL